MGLWKVHILNLSMFESTDPSNEILYISEKVQIFFTSKDGDSGGDGKGKTRKTDKAKDLLAKYGGAYLLTSISLSLVSFSLCYILVNAGIDVPGLLLKVE